MSEQNNNENPPPDPQPSRPKRENGTFMSNAEIEEAKKLKETHATSLEQNRNKRAKSSKYFLTYKGKTLSIQDWANITGTPYRTLLDRHKKWNWTDEEILIKAYAYPQG